MMKQDKISISDMAKLHGITRQTLIYYDEIGLFIPAFVDENGYRYYSWGQIPFLREICFLKSIGVSLKEIVEHFNDRTPQKEIELLHRQKQSIMKEISRLNKLNEAVQARMQIYMEAVDAHASEMFLPFVRFCPERKILFQEYYQPINKENLHHTLMDLWGRMFLAKSSSMSGFGSLFKQDAVLKGTPLEGAGSCLFLSSWNTSAFSVVTIPEGQYACLYKYGMPYDTGHLKRLMQWIKGNDMVLAGDIVDVCLLDTTFYQKSRELDFCLLQAPVRRREGAERNNNKR